MHDFGDKQFFEEINKIFDDFDYSKTASRKMYASIVYLANLVFNMDYIDFQSYQGDGKYHSISQSLADVNDFFEYLNPEYAYRFQNILHDTLFDLADKRIGKSVQFIYNTAKNMEDGPVSFVNNLGEVKIFYNNTLSDVIDIAHEMIHKFSIQCTDGFEPSCGEIWDFFCEVPSSTIEYLVFDYFKSKYDYQALQNRVVSRFKYNYGYAMEVLVESRLFEIFKNNNNHLSNEIIDDYLIKSQINDEIEINYIKKILNAIYSGKELIYEDSKQYLLGGVIGAYLYEQIQLDSDNNHILFNLIEVLGTNDYTKKRSYMKLSSMGFPFTKLWSIKTSPKQMVDLVSTYENYVNKVLSYVLDAEKTKVRKI